MSRISIHTNGISSYGTPIDPLSRKSKSQYIYKKL